MTQESPVAHFTLDDIYYIAHQYGVFLSRAEATNLLDNHVDYRMNDRPHSMACLHGYFRTH